MRTSDFRADLVAGATVALVGLPQCLAYATMSGLPPAYGLATAVVPGLVASIAGRSRYVITGPTNTTGLLVLAALVPFLGSNGLLAPAGLGWLATLTLLCGVLTVVLALSGGAALVRFIPESVLAEAVTLVTIAVVGIGQRLWRHLPTALIAVAGAAAAAWGALPDLQPAVIASLLLPSAAIVLLGTLELLVSVRADDSRPNVRHEILAQGSANVAGSVTAAFPASASLTRSTLLRFARPHSRAAAAFTALITLPMLIFGSRLIAYIPQASLAGVLLITAAVMVRQPTVGRVWRASPASRLLLGITAISTLVLPLAWAVFVGAGLGLIIHLARTSAPRVRALTFKNDRLVPIEDGQNPPVVVLEVSGAVHYAAVEPLLEDAERHLPPAVRLVIVDLSHAHELRFTGVRALEWWAADLERRGIRLRLAGVTPEVRDLLDSSDSHLAYTMSDAEPGRSAWNCFREAGGEM